MLDVNTKNREIGANPSSRKEVTATPAKTTVCTWIMLSGVRNNAREKKYSEGRQKAMVSRNKTGILTAEESACKGFFARPTVKP